MNAVEFVKECGIDVAKRTLSNAIGFGCSKVELFGGKYIFRTDDLKQIVDAWELVELLNGLIGAKAHVREVSEDYPYDYIGRNLYDFNIKCGTVVKAINLVEQCKK